MRSAILRTLCAPLVALAVIAASPSPSPTASPGPASNSAPIGPIGRITVTCKRTPMWTFYPGNNVPTRSGEPEATLGQTFGLVSGPRATLDGNEYYETDVQVVQPNAQGLHYWIYRRCAQVL